MCCDGKLWGPLVSLQVNQSSCSVEVVNSGYLLSCGGKLWVLSSCNRSQAPFRVEAGNSGFLLSCIGDLHVPLKLQLGSQASSRVAGGNSGFLLSHSRESEVLSSFSEKSVILLSCGAELRVPLEPWQ